MIIEAKIKQPRGLGFVTLSEQLTATFEASLDKKVILISAPAGFGKTSVVSALVDAYCPISAWLSLDTEDNNQAFFLFHLLAALGLLNETAKEKLLKVSEALDTYIQPGRNIKSFFGVLLNILHESECSLEKPPDRVLVLDNFHVLEKADILSGINFFLDYLPANYHICLLSRKVPGIHVVKRKLAQELVEINVQDLVFPIGAIKQLFKHQFGHEIAHEDALKIQKRTEGWPVAIQWVIRGLQSGKSISTLEEEEWDVTGIREYLITEIISSLPANVVDFLVKTVHLPRFHLALCIDVLENKDCAEVISFLKNESLFLVQADEEDWFSYQEVFRQTILSLPKQEAEVALVNKKSIQWFLDRKYFSLALSLSKEINDQHCLRQILRENGLDIVHQGYMVLVSDSLIALGLDLIKQDPRLVILQVRIWLAMAMTHIQPVETFMEIGGSIYNYEPSAADWHQEYNYVQSCIARLKGDVTAANKLLLSSSGVSQERMTPESQLSLAMNTYLKGNLKEAAVNASRALALAYEQNHVEMVESCAVRLAWVLQWQGQYGQAKTIYHQSREWLSQRKRLTNSFIAWQNLMLSAIHREFNELSSARECMQAVFEFKDLDPKLKLFAPFSNARLLLSEGKLEEAKLELDKVETQYLPMEKSIQGFPSIDAERIKIDLLQGSLNLAKAWVVEKEACLIDNSAYRFEEEQLCLARAYIMLGEDVQKIETLLAGVIARSEQGGRINNALTARLLLAAHYDRIGKTSQALRLMEKVLGPASAVGYVRLFLDEPVPLLSLMTKLSKNNRHLETVNYLVQFMGPQQLVMESALVEPLSRRELDVLDLLDKGYANKEIGDKLFIGVGTVKTHVRNILSKLAASNRTQAVAEARKLKILENQ